MRLLFKSVLNWHEYGRYFVVMSKPKNVQGEKTAEEPKEDGKEFWAKLRSPGILDLVRPIAGFEDSIRKVRFMIISHSLEISVTPFILH